MAATGAPISPRRGMEEGSDITSQNKVGTYLILLSSPTEWEGTRERVPERLIRRMKRILRFCQPVRSGRQVSLRPNQLLPFRYLSNQSSVRRIASIWFSRFSKPWPSLALNNVASDYGQLTTKTEIPSHPTRLKVHLLSRARGVPGSRRPLTLTWETLPLKSERCRFPDLGCLTSRSSRRRAF